MSNRWAALKEACDWWESHLKGFEKRHGGDAEIRLERRTLTSLRKLTDEPTTHAIAKENDDA
jgi:hypothetical protein